MNGLQSVIEYPDFNHCIFRQGFAFTSICEPANVLDAIVVRCPEQSECWSPKKSFSSRSLEEHIEFINLHKLEKAMIISEDISFITRCPTLRYLEIVPADTALPKFDYSPLYDMPQICYLLCKCSYGGPTENLHTEIDYSRINGIRKLQIEGPGHRGYDVLQDLEELKVYKDKANVDLKNIGKDRKLKSLWIVQSRIGSLTGVKDIKNLQDLCVWDCRALQDISELSYASALRSLSVRNCPGIKDFSVLPSLLNLEYLELHGQNALTDVAFLRHMPKLKFFALSMPVSSCDLTPCLNIPYVDLVKGKRGYNLKNKDLPKKLPVTPFRLK